MTTYSPLAVFRHMLLRATLVTLAPTLLAAGERKKRAENEEKSAKPRPLSPASPGMAALPHPETDVTQEAAPPMLGLAPSVPALALALLAFEAHISWGSVSRSWGVRRVRWIRRAKASRTLDDVADLVLTLESAMGWTGMEPAWSRRRDAWLEAVEAAGSVETLARLILELETATKWTAVTREWTTERPAWSSALTALRSANRSE